MNEALKLWLRESWELWYWAMFFPSRLQERMNEWSPVEERYGYRPDTTFQDILFSQTNRRFLFQFIQIVCLFSLPLIIEIIFYGRSLDLLLFPIILLATYGISLVFQIDFHFPLIFALVYLVNPTFFVTGLIKFIEFSLLVSQNFIGLLLISSLGFILTITLLSLEHSSLLTKKRLLIFVFILISVSCIWIGTQNWVFTLSVAGCLGIILLSYRKAFELEKILINVIGITITLSVSVVVCAFLLTSIDIASNIIISIVYSFLTFRSGYISQKVNYSIRYNVENITNYSYRICYSVCYNIGIILVSIVLGITVGVMMSIITNIGALPLPMFFFACWLVGVSLSTTKEKWLGIIAAIIMTAFRIEDESWLILLSFSITLLAYYRIYPEFISFIFKLVNTISYRVTQYPFDVLRRLPPFTSELLWLPLPNHDRILIAAFRQNPLEALPIFQSIQKQPLYGFQQTIKNALPQLVADQLTAIHTIPELITTATPNHAILPLLVPSLYQTELLDTKSLNVELLPTFQKYAQNIEAALQAGSIALRERGLERILDQLSTLNSQLSGLVKSKAIPRWQNVIKQWQTIIQQELEQLQRQSQGEILNPFQYGNPLTRDRAQLFKGRSAFADQIVRQILDRNRPTIILHGPRRCGKSSFLLNLPRLLTSDVLPVYIDLQSQSASQSEADFCFTIVRAIHRDARSQQVLLPAPPKREEFRLSPYTQLEDWLDTALTQLGDRRILLNIDEFEAIGIAMEQGRISNRLFDQLRSLIQHQSRLSFLFSGVQTLDELGTNWSSYFISAMPIEMTYLNPDEARELLLNPDPEFTLEYDTGIVDQILTLTRCHPYLLQLLGWVLVQLANTTHTQLVTPTLLQSAIPEAYINGIGYFTNVWEQFTGTNPTEITAGQQQLLALAQGQQPHPTNEAAQKSLQRMLRYHIIEKIDNQYKFEVPLIERWVREKSS